MGPLLFTLGTLAFGHVAELPVALASPQAVCHASVDEAAIEALKLAMALPPQVEHGGAIYDQGGCFVFSAPVTNYKPMAVLFRVRVSTSSKLAGIYHTHTLASGPCDHFSSEDVLQARALRVPSFLGVHGINHVRKLATGQMPPGPMTLDDRAVLRRSAVRGIVLRDLPVPARLKIS